MSGVRATVPGKLILMGEHAVVYGHPALVATIGLRARAEARRGAEGGVTFELRSLGVEGGASWDELARYAAGRREAWEAYRAAPGPESFRRVRGDDPAHLVKVALGEIALAEGAQTLPPLELAVVSEIPIGSGMGSSAAVAVAVLAAVLGLAGADTSLGRLERLALEVERRQHGMPSGADHGTVLRGGVQRIRRGGGGELSIAPLAAAAGALAGLVVYDTGEPAESTGEVVAEVRRRRDADRARFEALFEEMGRHTETLAAALRAAAVEPAAVRDTVRGFEGCLEAIGVVPAPVRRVVRAVEEAGGAAKISGAGALSARAAGVLLVFDGAGAAGALAAFERHAAPLGVGGLAVEALA